MLINDGKSRTSRNVNDIAFGILDRCLDFHHKMWPLQSDELIFEVYDRLMVMHASGDKACEQVVEGIKNKIPTDVNKASLLVTINYVVEAIQADLQGESALAVHLLMDASFWCGLMWSGQEIAGSQKKAVEVSKKKSAQSRSEARWRDREIIQDLIYKHVASRNDGRRWNSCADAAGKIRSKIPEIISQFNEKFDGNLQSESSRKVGTAWIPSEKVIEGWLNAMPNSDQLFESKAKRQAKK